MRDIRKISQLHNWDKNPRTISDQNLERLKKQILRVKEITGQYLYKPLVITPDGEVLGGNMRLKALKELKIEDIWVSVVNVKTDKEKLEIALSDNDRVGKYEYDELTILLEQFPEIEWGNFGVDLQEAPLLPELKETSFLDTLFDRAEIDTLIPNKYSYRQHSEEQIDHLVKSIQQNGIYRNIVIAKDRTILDGHAVVEAAKRLNYKIVPVKQLDIESDSEQALKIVISNNELGRFTDVDDRKLTEILKEIKEKGDAGLLGTGFDEQKLANLLMITRMASEINNQDTAAEWVGMPDYVEQGNEIKIVVNFRNIKDKLDFLKMLNESVSEKVRYVWYPHKDKMDLDSVKFENE